jgi:hypothetical protein
VQCPILTFHEISPLAWTLLFLGELLAAAAVAGRWSALPALRADGVRLLRTVCGIVSAGPATPNRPGAVNTGVPPAAEDSSDYSLCGGTAKVTKVVQESENKGRDCDCFDPCFIVLSFRRAQCGSRCSHCEAHPARTPLTSRTWTSLQPKRKQWT